MERPYTVQPQGSVLSVRMTGIAAGWEQWFLLKSDNHWDSPHCDRDTLRRHMNQARERRAGIFDFGDLFDGMGGKADKRSSKSTVRKEHQVDDYFDETERTAAGWYAEWLEWLILQGRGNHESAVLKHHEIDLTRRLVDRLNAKVPEGSTHQVYAGGYAGHVRFMFNPDGKGQRTSKLLFYTHGDGGNSPVTRGTIDTNRKAVWNPDADIICRGHNHQSWIVSVPRVRVGNTGKEYVDEQLHIDMGTYKQSFNLRGGYEIEKGFGPAAIGGVWLRFFWDNSKHGSIGMEAILAR